jgi:spore germination protein KC
MKKILVIIPILFLLTGCYNYRELNDLAIVSAISLSKNKDNFEIVVQIVNPKKEQDTSSSNEPDFVTFKSEGKSLQEAFRLIVKESPKKIYGTQMQLLIIDEDLAKDGIKDILDFFARDPEVRNEFYVLIGQDKDILEILTPLDNVSSQNITESLEANSKYLGYTNIVTYNDLLSNYQSDLVELALPSIKLMGNADNGSEEENIENTKADASVVLGNIGVFKNNKLLGYLSEEESLAYNFITDNVTGTIITNNYGNDSYIVSEIIKSKTDIKVINKDNKIVINIKGKASINEKNYDIDLTKEENIKKIEKDLNERIEEIVKDSVKSINNKYHSDIYGFRELYYKSDPTYYKKIKDKWDEEIFENLDIEVKGNVKIIEQGNLLGGLKNE